jgi:hypothetical protein
VKTFNLTTKLSPCKNSSITKSDRTISDHYQLGPPFFIIYRVVLLLTDYNTNIIMVLFPAGIQGHFNIDPKLEHCFQRWPDVLRLLGLTPLTYLSAFWCVRIDHYQLGPPFFIIYRVVLLLTDYNTNNKCCN